jgi:hypothetical protein
VKNWRAARARRTMNAYAADPSGRGFLGPRSAKFGLQLRENRCVDPVVTARLTILRARHPTVNNVNGLPDFNSLPVAKESDEQLAFDLEQDLSFPPPESSMDIFEREVRGKELLLELARSLGEQRAAVDILLFRKSLSQD